MQFADQTCVKGAEPLPAGTNFTHVYLTDKVYDVSGAWCMKCAAVARQRYAASKVVRAPQPA